MSKDSLEGKFKKDITTRYNEKYGNIQIHFDMIHLVNEDTAKVQFTLSDANGFITRYYGVATYQSMNLKTRFRSI